MQRLSDKGEVAEKLREVLNTRPDLYDQILTFETLDTTVSEDKLL